MGDIHKQKNQPQQLDENLKMSLDRLQKKNESADKKINEQYENILSDLKNLENTAMKIKHEDKQTTQKSNTSLYVKNTEKRVSAFNKSTSKTDESDKNEKKRHTWVSSTKSQEKNKRHKSQITDEAENKEYKTPREKEKRSNEEPIYKRHNKDESSPQNTSHIQRLRETKKDSSPQIKTEPNHDHNLLTTGQAVTDHSNRTANDTTIKQGNILEGVKTNRAFHLLRNKRIQDLMDSNMIITLDAIGGDGCCKRLLKNYDMNISVSTTKIQQHQLEMSKLSSHNRDLTISPHTHRNKQKSQSPSKDGRASNIPKDKKRKMEAKSSDRTINNKRKKDKEEEVQGLKPTRNNVETSIHQGNIILTNPENLITFNNDGQSSQYDRFGNNITTKYLNTQGSKSKNCITKERNQQIPMSS